MRQNYLARRLQTAAKRTTASHPKSTVVYFGFVYSLHCHPEMGHCQIFEIDTAQPQKTQINELNAKKFMIMKSVKSVE